MPQRRIRAVLHDWNGCLLNDVPHRYANGVVPIFQHYGLPVPTLTDYSHNISSDFMRFYYDRGIPDSGDRKADGDTLNAIMKAGMAKADVPPLFPETRQVLGALGARGTRQLLVSSIMDEIFRLQVGHHGVADFFHELHGGIRKKTPVFTELLERHGVAPQEAIGFTDMMADVRELKEAGVQAILIPRGYIEPDLTVASDMLIASDLEHALRLVGELEQGS